MTKKKKISTKIYQAVKALPFVGDIPIYADGTSIKQPIIQEESNKIQQVSITNSIPPLDITLKQVDFTLASQISNLNIDQVARGDIYKYSTESTWFSADTTAWNTTGSLEAQHTIVAKSRLMALSASVIIRSGTINYGAIHVYITDSAGTTLMLFEKPFTNTSLGNDLNLAFNQEIIIPAGAIVYMYIRKDTTNCTAVGKFCIMLQAI